MMGDDGEMSIEYLQSAVRDMILSFCALDLSSFPRFRKREEEEMTRRRTRRTVSE